MSDITFRDNSDEVLRQMAAAKARALERCGMQAEGYAADLCPVDTGALRGSISHKCDGDTAYIGSNQDYAAYVELGTGKFYSGGRQTPWFYVDDNGAGHFTHGQQAQPFLKPAVADHAQTYRNIVEDEMKGK